ncbi:hypothetical protein [uncultured Roseibium sp.]|uniref:hypothetical protein n=1 Tax=uncultured Roseibium sp. TaxID=1936171 RepID=UPI0026381ADE|nr:hypothetical protein [uncultured Roseibium sp.]
MATEDDVWRRIASRKEFVAAYADKVLVGEELRFTIHSTGKISGHVEGLDLVGEWYWEDGYFCRTATLNGEALALDCEIIEGCGHQMRYTREKGRGEFSIVSVEQDLPE